MLLPFFASLLSWNSGSFWKHFPLCISICWSFLHQRWNVFSIFDKFSKSYWKIICLLNGKVWISSAICEDLRLHPRPAWDENELIQGRSCKFLTPASCHQGDAKVPRIHQFLLPVIQVFCCVMLPLTSLTKWKPRTLKWFNVVTQAFQNLKERFTSSPILHHSKPLTSRCSYSRLRQAEHRHTGGSLGAKSRSVLF